MPSDGSRPLHQKRTLGAQIGPPILPSCPTMMASWSFEPDTIEGKPTKFEDIEFMMAFVEESTKSEIVLAVIIVGVIAVALAVALAEDIERDCEFFQC